MVAPDGKTEEENVVNVIIPVYKARATLCDAFDSLVAQTKKMFIVTCIQDADDEDYTDIVEEYRRRGLQIRWLKNEVNMGPGVSRQVGIDSDEMCDRIMFLDADDMFFPNTIECAYDESKKTDADIIAFNFICEQTPNPPMLMEVEKIPCTWNHGKIYKKSYLKSINLRWRDDLRRNEDSYFNLVAWNGTTNKAFVRQPAYLWRNNQASLTRIEGTEGFFLRGADQYIWSQVMGMEKLIELGKLSAPLLAMTLCNIYDTYMHAVHKKMDLNMMDLYLSRFRANHAVQTTMQSPDFWKVTSQFVKACDWYDTTLYFYKERFIDWLTRCVRAVGPYAHEMSEEEIKAAQAAQEGANK